MVKIKIDLEQCIGCGACVNACPVELYKIDKTSGDKAKVAGDTDTCILCRACETTCPVGAIKITE